MLLVPCGCSFVLVLKIQKCNTSLDVFFFVRFDLDCGPKQKCDVLVLHYTRLLFWKIGLSGECTFILSHLIQTCHFLSTNMYSSNKYLGFMCLLFDKKSPT